MYSEQHVAYYGQIKCLEPAGSSEDNSETVVKCWSYDYIPLQLEVLLGLSEHISYGW